MPLYVYRCHKCKKMFEVIVPLKDYEKKLPCKYCRKQMEKIIMPVCFRIH
jgi:putative FmdB family regulatory protein